MTVFACYYIYKLLFARKLPIILHLHGGIQTEDFIATSMIEKIMLFIKRYFFDLIIGKIMMKQAEAIISVSKEDLLAVNRVFKANRRKNNYFIPNAIDIEKFKKFPSLTRKYLGFIGRLTKIKGLDIFLSLINEFNKIEKNQEYLIIGQGPYLSDVKKAIKEYPIHFYEQIPYDKIPEFYNQCEIFIQTSRAEGLPTCVLEALSCEVPVVASNVGGINEIVLDEQNGYKYNSGDIKQAIEFIIKIKKDNDFEKMGKKGRQLIINNYSWNSIIKKIYYIYQKLHK